MQQGKSMVKISARLSRFSVAIGIEGIPSTLKNAASL
jgi:hypothetical protein